MSENKFKVPAKKPASKKPGSAENKQSPTKDKLAKARVRTSSIKFEKKALPDVADLGNMTRDERIKTVLKEDEGKKSTAKAKNQTKPKTSAKSNRYESMKGSIARAKNIPRTQRKGSINYEKKDNAAFYTRIAILILALVMILIIILLVIRFKKNNDTPEATQPAVHETVAIIEDIPYSPSLSEINVTIRSGMTATQAVNLLSEVTDTDALLDYLRENNLTGKIQSGTYRVTSSMKTEEIATLLTTRKESIPDGVIRIYAGYTIDDIDEVLSSRGLAKRGDFIAATERLQREKGLSFIEGYLLSGDYTFTDPYTLASDMLEALLEVIRHNAKAVAESNLSLDDIVTIASMVNRETQNEEQMGLIARIILNRLAINMPLGIDATTRYELDDWANPIPQSVYETITPYNTRRKAGLPPSGIGCPASSALLATLYPGETEDLFYLHDRAGNLYTSATYEEHLVKHDLLY